MPRPDPISNIHPLRPEDRRFVEGPVDFVERFRFIPSPPVPPTRLERICAWLEDTYGGPRGFVWFAGTVLPICAAAFALGYFGLRELLAVLS